MQFADTHVLIVDYRQDILDQLSQRFSENRAIAHQCHDRIEAHGKLWELVNKGVTPRAILTNWLLQDDKARAFYAAIGREVDHTSLNLLHNAVNIDREDQTIIVCYSKDHLETTSAVETAGILDKVVIVNQNTTTIEEMVRILMRDERTRIIKHFKEESKTDAFRRKLKEKKKLSGVAEQT